MSASIESSDINNVHEEVFRFNEWVIVSRRSHILQSQCVSPFICDKTKSQSQQSNSEPDLQNLCLLCRYESLLSIPHMPDMTYARNGLKVEHKNGFALEFNCCDALKRVKKELPTHLKVAASESWMKARSDCEYTKIQKKPFDWTFTTDYSGSHVCNANGVSFKCESTEQRIDVEKLKQKEDILYYDDVHLFEDELADHGVAQCSVKIRVMKNSFFILLRFFLRVDNVLVRLNDNRYYHEVGTNFILREYTGKEAILSQLDIPTAVITNPVELSNHLPTSELVCEKLIIPDS